MQNERSGSVADISTERPDELRYATVNELPKEINACPLFGALAVLREELEISTAARFHG